MVKVKTISRDSRDYVKSNTGDLSPLLKNPAPVLHPFDKNREYQKASNAEKLNKVFSKPFAFNLEGHVDGIFSMRRHPTSIKTVASGSCDGEIRIWDLSRRMATAQWTAHSGFVRGVSFSPDGERFYSCGEDKFIKQWELPNNDSLLLSDHDLKPVCTWTSPLDSPITSIDNQYHSTYFATTTGNIVNVWDPKRSQPILKCEWGEQSVTAVRFNPIETAIIATSSEDRCLRFFDVRTSTAMSKLEFDTRVNAFSWNPVNPNIISLANDDFTAYTFDMRYLNCALQSHMGHTGAIIAIDYSPTGQEFCTGSYDKSIRIFKDNSRDSADCYYTKRMQKVFAVQYSGDASYILCGSDDTNIRVWKAQAARNTALQTRREKKKGIEDQALTAKYEHMSEIKKIKRKQLPIHIKCTNDTLKIMHASKKRKQKNILNHTSEANAKKIKIISKKKDAIIAVHK